MDPRFVPLIIAGGFVLMGALFITIGLVRTRMTRGWTMTTGQVITRDGGTEGWPARYPTFRWQDQHGVEHRRTSSVYASLGPRPGTLVPVRYDPADPSRAVIATTVQSGRIFVVIGAVIIGLGLVAGVFGYAVTNAFARL